MRRLLLLACLVPTAALAQEPERFQLERTENGYVRLDTETGAMSVCQEQGDQLVCRAATTTDAREAMEADPDGLQAQLEALERRVAALEEGRGGLPSEQELDRTLSFMERFFRTFMGLAREWSEDEPAANRTEL